MSSKYKNDIIRLRKQEKTYDEIKQKLGCSKSTISYHCKQEGLEDIGKKKKEVNEKTKKKIKSLRKEKTINQVSKELGVGKSTVVKYSDPSDNQKTEVRSSLEKEKYLESKKYRGELAEEKIAVRFMEKGYTVLDPRGREKYDIVIQKNDKFIKI
jgi:DNA invertase Pin-like site-specific DNA recombinase